MWLTKDFHVNSIQKLHQDHSSEIRGSCLMKWKTWNMSGLFIYTNHPLLFAFCAARKEKCVFSSSRNLLFLKSEKVYIVQTMNLACHPQETMPAPGVRWYYLWFHYYWLLDSHVNNNHIVRYSKENTSKVKLFSFG